MPLSQIVLPPIAAYDIFAPAFRAYSETRKRYLQKVEEIVIARIGSGGSLLDVGAGDGLRALRISRAAGVERVVLLEPSAGMRARCPEGAEIWPCSVSEIPATAPPFEVITCLWNVLGHLQDNRQRSLMLAKLKELMVPRGVIFLDVSHRYNASSYGWPRTLLRMVHDFVRPSETHGDAVVSWKANGRTIQTRGHLFTQGELKRLFCGAGLKVAGRWIINYETGAECKRPTSGHLLYQLASA